MMKINREGREITLLSKEECSNLLNDAFKKVEKIEKKEKNSLAWKNFFRKWLTFFKFNVK